MDERFLRSCYCGKHRVLGLKLRPYSLSHLLALEAVKSPLVQSGTRGSSSALISAVRICWQDQFVDSPETFRRPRTRFRDVPLVPYLDLNPAYLLRETVKFFKYISAYSQNPEFWENENPEDLEDFESNQISLTGPYVLAQAVSVLMYYPNMTERRAWTMPLGLLSWYNGQIAEYKYRTKFWDDEQETDIETALQKAESEITPAMKARLAKMVTDSKKASTPKTTRIGER